MPGRGLDSDGWVVSGLASSCALLCESAPAQNLSRFLDRFFAAAACSSSQQAPSFRRCSCPAISFHGQCGPCTTLVLCCWPCGWRVEWLGTYGWVGAVRLLRGSAKQWLPVGSSGNCDFLFVSHLALPTHHPTPHYTTQVYQRSIVLASWARLLRLALLRSSHPDSELNNTPSIS